VDLLDEAGRRRLGTLALGGAAAASPPDRLDGDREDGSRPLR
jgi:hypothetical protein